MAVRSSFLFGFNPTSKIKRVWKDNSSEKLNPTCPVGKLDALEKMTDDDFEGGFLQILLDPSEKYLFATREGRASKARRMTFD